LSREDTRRHPVALFVEGEARKNRPTANEVANPRAMAGGGVAGDKPQARLFPPLTRQ